MNKTCKTCKHWVGRLDGRKEAMGNPLHLGDCWNPKLNLAFNNNLKGREFSTTDGMWNVHFKDPITGMDFGCIHWEFAEPESRRTRLV